jgi:hypothetical protein
MEQIRLNPATHPDRRLVLKSAVAAVAAIMGPVRICRNIEGRP